MEGRRTAHLGGAGSPAALVQGEGIPGLAGRARGGAGRRETRSRGRRAVRIEVSGDRAKSFRPDPRAASYPVEGDAAIGKDLAARVGNPRQLAVAVCRAFGTLHGHDADWTSTDSKERRALAAVHTVGAEDFAAALEEVRQDRDAFRGAARIFFFEKFGDRINPKARTDWTLRLAEIVLAEDSDMNKQILLGKLGSDKSPQVRDLLRKVFRGETGREIDRAHAWDDDPGLRAAAAITLAMQGDTSIEEEARQLLAKATAKQDVAALEVCLALLGEPERIKTEHFRLNSYFVGLGALKAIERCQGKFGMEALVKGGIHHPYGRVRDEALDTFRRITGRKMTEGEIEDWWEVEHEGQRSRPQPVLSFAGDAEFRVRSVQPRRHLDRRGRQQSDRDDLERRYGRHEAHAPRAHRHGRGRGV